jgi:UDP-glucose 4-epimerase
MSILVTGGAGFLGSHLVDRWVREGYEVVALDDLSSGDPANLEGALASGRARLVRGDARDAALVGRLVADAEVVFHLAASVGVRRVAEDPVGTWSRNVEGAACVLSACAARGRRVLLASTSEVYGPLAAGVLAEHAPARLDLAGRRDVYAVSKAAAEAYAFALHRSALLPVTVMRLFNVVGARQSARYGMVLPRFAAAAVRGEALPVHGDGRQTRCFLHVDDAVEASVRLARAVASEGLAVNVGSEEEVPVLDLARAVARAAGTGAVVRFVPFEEVYGEGFVDPPRRRPDASRLRALTGFVPRRGLADAVADAVAAARAALGPAPSPAAG